MRSLELVALITLLVAAFAQAARISPAARTVFVVSAAVALVLHLVLQGARWTMVPAYLLAVMLAITAIILRRRAVPIRGDASFPTVTSSWRRWAGRSAAVVLVLASGVLSETFAFAKLPAPTGPHAVGTRWLVLVDSARNDSVRGSFRTLLVRLWYPTDSAIGRPTSLWKPPVARRMAVAYHFPFFAFRYASRIPAHSYEGAPLARGTIRVPVVLFSHGYGSRGFESQNTILMEELASHGYLVVSTAHPRDASIVALPDGRVIDGLEGPASGEEQFRRRSGATLNRFKRADSAGQMAVLNELMSIAEVRQPTIDSWMADTRFTLDRLRSMSAPIGNDTLFAGRLALDSVGVIGWSLGGALATEFCILDARCGAGVTLDGLAFSATTLRPMPHAFLFTSSADNESMHRPFYQRAEAPAYRVNIPRTRHLDFTDIGLILPRYARREFLGGIEPRRMQALLGRLAVAFFDTHLAGVRTFPADSIRRSFPELSLESRRGR